jgi:hypothetical protein
VLVAHACNPNSWKGWDQEDLVWEETPSPTITNKETKKKNERETEKGILDSTPVTFFFQFFIYLLRYNLQSTDKYTYHICIGHLNKVLHIYLYNTTHRT